MAQAAWGTKRRCPSCGAHYYDLNKDPVICPKCDTPYQAGQMRKRLAPVVPLRSRVPKEQQVESLELEEGTEREDYEREETEGEEEREWSGEDGEESREDRGY